VAEDAERKRQEFQWIAALELMGRDTVRIKLGQMLSDRSATFKLPNMPGCKRRFAEDWLGGGEAEGKATEAKRYRYGLAVAVLGVVVAIVMWWFR